MKQIRRTLLAAAVAVAAAGPASLAHAACFGGATTAYACVYPEHLAVDPEGGPPVQECINLGGPPGTCTVTVDEHLPSVGTTGPLTDVECPACTAPYEAVDEATRNLADRFSDCGTEMSRFLADLRDGGSTTAPNLADECIGEIVDGVGEITGDE